MSEAVQIISAADDRYFPGLLVTLFTARLFSETEGELAFTVLHERLSAKHEGELRRVLDRTGRPYSLRLKAVDTRQFAETPEFFFPSKLTYARLVIPELFETGCVIYIDSDILVQQDLAKLPGLFEGEKYLVAGCAHPGEIRLNAAFQPEMPLEYDGALPYLNAGFLVFDPRRWKEEGTAQECLEFLRDYGQYTNACDQSGINYVCRGRIQFLDMVWNTLARRLHPEEQFRAMAERACNVHFIQKNKPWFSYQVSSLGSQLFNLVCENAGYRPPSAEYRRGRRLYGWISAIKGMTGKHPVAPGVREWLAERAATMTRRMSG